jgi:Flp pilus assembly protein TadG
MTLKLLRDDTEGGALIEFSITLPLFLFLMLGLVQAGSMFWTQAGLQHGVEVAARCASVNYSASRLGLNTSCFGVDPSTVIADTTNATIKQYAHDNSFGLVVPPVSDFSVTATLPTSGSCATTNGYLVTVSAQYPLISYIFPVTIAARSTFSIDCS